VTNEPNPVEQAAAEVAEQSVDSGAEPKAEEAKPEEKPARTREQKELARLQRRIDDRTRRMREAEDRIFDLERQLREGGQRDTVAPTSDGDALTLSPAQLQELVQERARQLAPRLTEQQAAIEKQQRVIDGLATSLGQERFDALAADLDAAFGGLKTGRDGPPKPATAALFEADDTQALIEYLADPDNAAEARTISRLGPVQAGIAVARLEVKLKAAKTTPKPEPSKAPAPIETPRAEGKVERDPSQMTDSEFAAWRRRQIAQRR